MISCKSDFFSFSLANKSLAFLNSRISCSAILISVLSLRPTGLLCSGNCLLVIFCSLLQVKVFLTEECFGGEQALALCQEMLRLWDDLFGEEIGE